MRILTVDLASKFSAYMVTEPGGQVIVQGDSRDETAFSFVAVLRQAADGCDLVIVEDVPYGISNQSMVKPVLRLQGALLHAFSDILDTVVFVNPSTWQRKYPGVARGDKADREEAARSHAEDLGYAPPDLVQEHIDGLPEGAKVLKKHTNPLKKAMTDYVDAFLMSDWARSFPSVDDLRAQSGVQPPNI